MASKYRKYERKEIKKQEIAPIWRGIGCILFVIVPALSYLFTTLAVPPIVATGQVPPEIMAPIKFPPWTTKVFVISDITAYLGSIEGLWLKVIIFFVILLLLVAVASLIYTMVQSIAGPPRYTEMAAPEAERGAKRYTR